MSQTRLWVQIIQVTTPPHTFFSPSTVLIPGLRTVSTQALLYLHLPFHSASYLDHCCHENHHRTKITTPCFASSDHDMHSINNQALSPLLQFITCTFLNAHRPLAFQTAILNSSFAKFLLSSSISFRPPFGICAHSFRPRLRFSSKRALIKA